MSTIDQLKTMLSMERQRIGAGFDIADIVDVVEQWMGLPPPAPVASAETCSGKHARCCHHLGCHVANCKCPCADCVPDAEKPPAAGDDEVMKVRMVPANPETGPHYLSATLKDCAKASALVADKELRRVASIATDAMIKLQQERDAALRDLAESRRALSQRDARVQELALEVMDARRAGEVMRAAGTLLYRQVLDSNSWINFGASRPGAGLCICHDRDVAGGFDVEEATEPAVHDAVCTPFRAALAAWDALESPSAVVDDERAATPVACEEYIPEDDKHRTVVRVNPSGSVLVGHQYFYEGEWLDDQESGAFLDVEEMAVLDRIRGRKAGA